MSARAAAACAAWSSRIHPAHSLRGSARDSEKAYKVGFIAEGPKNGESVALVAEQQRASCPTSWLLLHDSSIYRFWRRVLLVASIASLIIFPLELALVHQTQMERVVIVLDVLFAIDIMISFRLSFADESTGRFVVESKAIAKHYATGYFMPDVLSVFPVFTMLMTHDGPIALFGFLRLLRVRHILPVFSELEKMESLEYTTTCLLKFLLLLLLDAHSGGCLMWFLASLRDFREGETWVSTELAFGASVGEQYTACIYWAVTTLTTVGYGDYSPVSIEERLFGSLYMLFNMGILAYIIGMVSSLSTRGDDERALYRERLKNLKRYAKLNNLSPELYISMRKYVAMLASTQTSASEFEKHLPTFLSAKARNLRNRPILARIPLLAGRANNHAAAAAKRRMQTRRQPMLQRSLSSSLTQNRFITALTARMTEVELMSGVRVFEAGDIAQELWVIRTGKAALMVFDSAGYEQPVHSFTDGGLLGASSFFTGLPMRWSIKISAATTALKLIESDRDALFTAFPEEASRIADEIGQMVAELRRNANAILEERGYDGVAQGLKPDGAPKGPRWPDMVRDSLLKKQRSSVGPKCNGGDFPEGWCGVRRNSSPLLAVARMACRGSKPDNASPTGFPAASRRRSNPGVDPDAPSGAMLKILFDKYGQAMYNFVYTCDILLSDLESNRAKKEGGLSATLCDLASKNGIAQLQEILAQSNLEAITPDYDGRTPMHLAAARGHVGALELFLAKGCASSSLDRFGRTPMYEAVLARSNGCIQTLLRHDAHLGLSAEDTGIEMCRWASEGDANMLSLLLMAGADPAACNYDGRTCLHLVASAGNEELVDVILKHARASSTAVQLVAMKDRHGQTPIDAAMEGGFPAIVAMLNACKTTRLCKDRTYPEDLLDEMQLG